MKKILFLLLFTLELNAQNSKIDSIKKVLNTNLTPKERFNIYLKLVIYYVELNDDSTNKYQNLISHWAKLSQDLTKIGISHYLKSSILNYRGKFVEAVSESILAIAYFEKTKNNLYLGKTYSGLCYFYNRMGDAQHLESFSKKGEEYGIKSIEILLKTKDYNSQASAYLNLGIVQIDLNNLKGAKESFLKGIAIGNKNGIAPNLLATLLGQLGEVILEYDKDPDSTIRYLTKALELFSLDNKKSDFEHTYRTISKAYLIKKDYKYAIYYAGKSVKLAEQIKDNHKLFNSYKILFEVNEAMGNYKAALESLKLQKKYEDTTLTNDKLKTIADVETKYQTVKKEAEIVVLSEQNKAQNRQLWFLVLGLILSIGSFGAIYWQNKKIKVSQKLVSEQSEQLKLMMKELHHRVKNNLAIVSGMLRIQSNKLKDEAAIQAVRQGQQRVDAMSLIHQKLYQTDKVTSVNIKELV